jgi:hypothetical protein
MRCKLCRRWAAEDGGGGGSGLCRYHSAARDALKRAYEAWREAYSGLSWRDYLNRVKALEQTGQWTREVVALEEEARTD